MTSPMNHLIHHIGTGRSMSRAHCIVGLENVPCIQKMCKLYKLQKQYCLLFWKKESSRMFEMNIIFACRFVLMNANVTHLTFALAWFSNKNLTICWCPVAVLCNKAVHPRTSLHSSCAPCCTERKFHPVLYIECWVFWERNCIIQSTTFLKFLTWISPAVGSRRCSRYHSWRRASGVWVL